MEPFAIRGLKQIAATGPTFIYEYTLNSGETVIYNRSGKVDERFTGGRERFQMNLRQLDGQWKVTSLTRIAQ